ncbi:hypothetical protein [Aliarcobacter cryaerophilus]|uniref:hypothetical protein n=1 Tax=Aliarcobacter cryaerophilus TaxID=28198 RepID=UPI0021B1953A|nr:hypothetical protein [Aliarcobacter cryaerophilus]MCT7484774.1 hypothetical protein [Aliarcobacter cryaerophilus]
MTKKNNSVILKQLIRQFSNGSFNSLLNSLIKFKTESDLDVIKANFNYLYKNTQLSNIIEKHLFPENLSDLKNYPRIVKTTMERELLWTAFLINNNVNKINEYLLFKKEYESYVFIGEYHEALKILNLVKEYFGYSLWLIQNELILKQKIEGLESQKDYAKKLKENSNKKTFISFFIHFFSIKCEDNITSNNFKTILEENLYSLENRSNVKEYIRFKCLMMNSLEINNASEIENLFHWENNSSLIDIYETFIHIFTIWTSKFYNTNKEETTTFRKVLYSLKEDINDKRIKSLNRVYGRSSELYGYEKNERIIDAFDCYTYGEYFNCIKLCNQLFDDGIFDISLIDIFVHSHIYQGIAPVIHMNSIKDILVKNLYHIILKDDKTLVSFVNLLNLMSIYQSFEWINGLYAFLDNQTSGMKILQKEQSLYLKLLSSGIPSPYKSDIYSENPKVKYLNQLESLKSNSSMFNLFKQRKNNLIVEDKKIPYYRTMKYKAINAYHNENFDDAKILFKTLADNDNELISIDAKSAYLNTLIVLEEYDLCCELLVKYILQKEYIYINLPLQNLVDKFDKPKKWPKSIYTPIFFKLHTLHISEKENYLRLSYDKFLDQNNCKKPSELLQKYKYFYDQEKFLEISYFLKEICVPELMKYSAYIDSTSIAEEERILICRILKKFDPSNAKEYDLEINERTKKIVIKNGVKRVGKSKVFVDTVQVKQYYKKKLLDENYKRYKALKRDIEDDQISQIIDIADQVLSENNIVDKDEYYSSNDIKLFNIPANEKRDLFTKIMKEVIDGFINREFGLNVYISTRIRHGYLAKELRNPLEIENLVTTQIKNEETNEKIYNENIFWKDKLSLQCSVKRTQILKRLEEFTRKFDNYTDYIIDNLLIISTQTRTDALFKYEINALEQRKLEDLISDDTEYEDFVDIVIKWMWKKTDINLKIIREYFEIEIKKQFLIFFDDLVKEIETINGETNSKELYDSIAKAKTSIQTTIDNIKTWFNRTDLNVYEDYNIEIAIETTKNILLKTNSSTTSLDLKFKANQILEMKGKTFEYFVDIFLILMNNAFVHSGCDNVQNISLEIEKIDKNIEIKIINPVISQKSIEELNRELEIFNQNTLNENSEKVLISRKGTGIFRIKKILNNDLFCENTLDYKYIETEIYESKKGFELNLILINEELTNEKNLTN